MDSAADAMLLKDSLYFDADWYLNKYPDVAITGMDPAAHYLFFGAKLERNPSPYFDAKYYLEANRDVKLAGINPLLHYIKHGHHEGRAAAAVAMTIKPEYQSATTYFKIHASNSPKAPADLFNLHSKYSHANNVVVMWAKNITDFRKILGLADKLGENVNLIALIPSAFNYDQLVTIDSAHKEIDIVTFTFENQISALLRLINGDLFYSSMSFFLINFEENINFTIDENTFNTIKFLSTNQVHNFGVVSCDHNPEQQLSETIIRKSEALLEKIGSHVSPDAGSSLSLSLCYIHPLIIKSIKALCVDPLTLNQSSQSDVLGIFKTILLTMANEGLLDATSFSKAELLSSVYQKNICSIAFYLPQFHVTPENDKWWGKGFSEWHNVTQAKPLFENHYQPRMPADLGFYDLSSIEIQIKQIELAKRFNIDGFCYYYYWFDGKKVLNKPIENMLANKSIDMPFCICWANESWFRNGDGPNQHVLLAQSYSEETNKALILEFIEYMKDPRYIRHEGKPVLVVYRIKIIPEWKKVARMWREECRRAGVGEIHLCAIHFDQEEMDGDPELHNLDSYVAVPPHELTLEDHRGKVANLVKDFGGALYSYDAAMTSDIERYAKGYSWPIHRGAMMGWDNTARRLKDSRIFFGCTPLKFRRWLKTIKEQENLFNPSKESLLFINAWNGWAEGTTLEPDQRFGTSYLDAVYSVLGRKQSEVKAIAPEKKTIVGKPINPLAKPLHFQGNRGVNSQCPNLLLCAHVSGQQLFGSERSFLDVLRSLTNLGYNIIVTLPSANNKAYIEEIKNYSTDIYVINYKQWIDNRNHEPQVTLAFCDLLAAHAIDLVYANTIVLIEPLKAAKLMGIKSVVHARELITFDAPLQERIGLSAPEIISQVFKSCDYIIANSLATKTVFAREGKTFCAPNAIDVHLFPPENNIEGKIKVGIISSNVPKKGVADFLKVAQLCQENDNIEFLVMGPDNKYTEEWKLQQQRGALSSNIIFTGYINTPQEAIRKINLLINTSAFAESFGRSVAEAMAGYRPVIAYEWGALNELVITGETGYLAPYGDYQTIAATLLKLSETPEKIIELGIKARAHVESNYSHSVLEKNLHHALTSIFAEKKGNRTPLVSTTIVIPVYNAATEVVQCLESLYLHTVFHNTKVIIINDGSSDPNIKAIVDSYSDRPNTSVYHNDVNIGYTKTVNRGISLADDESDIILLNSDTRLTPFWLEGLRATAYTAADIGTVTAMSDNAGAFSFPLMNQANPVPSYLTESEYASLVIAKTFDCEPVEVPTGSGFCFYIKRRLINHIGTFDEVLFPRGYGEENDFCMRAINAGFKNLITPWSYVYHARTASFKGEKEKLVEEGVSKVITKFPHYPAEVKKAFHGEKITLLRNKLLR